MISYTKYRTDFGTLSKNSSTANLALGDTLINQSLRYLTGKFYFNERSYSTLTVANQQFYPLPPQVKRLIDVTVTIGGVVWLTKPCSNREYWDSLNVITFYQDFPSFHFVYNGNEVGIWPTPASAGNTITMNYQIRTTDLSMADVTHTTASTTVSIITNTTTVTAAGSAFKAWMVGEWIQIPPSSTDATNGDNKWYQIASVTSATVLVLENPYTGATVTGANFTIGQMPILAEDYQDLALYRSLWIYFTSIVPDKSRASLYEDLYNKGYAMLETEYGQKVTSPVLTDTDAPVYNPNLFVSSIQQA
jgi:hypothetical protein